MSDNWLLAAAMAFALTDSDCSRDAGENQCDSSSKPAAVVRVAAADLKFVFEETTAEFAKSRDIRVGTSFGSSDNYYAQLARRAPFDVFLTADIAYPRRLIVDGLAIEGREFLDAFGRIVVGNRHVSPLDLESLGMKAYLAPGVAKVAIANPRYVPYGRAAEAAMKKLGVYDAVESKLVLGENIAQAAQFVESGSADVGLYILGATSPTGPVGQAFG